LEGCGWGQRRGLNARRVQPIAGLGGSYLGLREGVAPLDLARLDPAVRLARQGPVADRRIKRNFVARCVRRHLAGLSGVTTSSPHPQQHRCAAVL